MNHFKITITKQVLTTCEFTMDLSRVIDKHFENLKQLIDDDEVNGSWKQYSNGRVKYVLNIPEENAKQIMKHLTHEFYKPVIFEN